MKLKIGDKIPFCNLYHAATARFYGIYKPEYVSIIDDTPMGLLLVEFKIPDDKSYGYTANKYRFYINPSMLQQMKKTPEQRITELEEKFNKELAEIKAEIKPKELTLEYIKKNANLIELDSFFMPNGRYDKLYAIRDMMVVADHLNGDWKPDWEGQSGKYYIYYYHAQKKGVVECSYEFSSHPAYFSCKRIAEQAIRILGEEKIKLALS